MTICESCIGAEHSPTKACEGCSCPTCGKDAGRKDDKGKRRWSLFPWRAAEHVVKVLEYGADRYGAQNWQNVERGQCRYAEALQRHLIAWWEGEDTDEESGLPHIAHVACNALFLVALSCDD